MNFDFDISNLVDDLGYYFVMSGINTTISNTTDWGDPITASGVSYVLKGIPQEMDGTEMKVQEGLLQKSDVIIWVDEDETNSGEIRTDNTITMSGAVVGTISGVFRIVNVVHNEGHYEIQAKRINFV